MDKNIISQQLGAISKGIQSLDGAELYINVLDACGELVNIVAEQICCEKMDNESIKDIAASMSFIAKGLENISEASCNADCLKVKVDSVEKLEKAVVERKELIEKERKAKEELVVVDAVIETLRPKVEQLENAYKERSNFKETLERTLEDYSEEKMEALEKNVTELTEMLAERQSEHQALVEKKEEHESKIKALEDEIAKYPTEQQLVEAYDKKSAEFKRLLTAKEECSEDKQIELNEEILKIKKDVDKLDAAMTLLRNTKEEIDGAKTKIETEKGVFETDFVEKLTGAMDDLKNNMSTHRETLNKLKDDALELKKHIAECDEIYKNYTFLFDTCKVPIKAISKATKTEYEELTKTYDVRKSKYVTELTDDIESKLNELGDIISVCVKATTIDQKALQKKAFEKGEKN